jgi:hypothetical protein
MDRRTFLAGAAALALGGHRMPDPSVPGNLADRLRRPLHLLSRSDRCANA